MTAGVGRYSSTGSPLTGYTGGLLQVVVGVVLAPNGDIYVSDIGGFVGGDNKIVKINPSSGTQVLVAGGGLLNAALPVDLARAETGEIYVAMGVSGPAGILKITPEGTVSALPTGGLLSEPTGITFGRTGELIVADGDGELIKVDPVTGAQTPFLADGPFTSPAGARRIEPLDLIFADGFQ
jgi:streptogramin lyase